MLKSPLAFVPFLIAAMAVVLGACNSSTSQSDAPTSTDPQVQAGFKLVGDRSCTSCHSTNGSSRSGPTWKGIAGSTVTLTDGRTVTIDDAYLRRALTDSDADVRTGFRPGVMSSYMRNQKALTSEEVDQIVAYLDTVK